MPATYTPLRYPGGKTKIYPLVSSVIDENGLGGCVYAEAFCGGAGLAMKLLMRGDVTRVVLNDFDPAVYSIWDAVVNHPDELCAYIESAPLSMDEWHRCRDVYLQCTEPSLSLGKAALFLNRTNRSGILGAGVIGGKAQTGAYGIDARFNRRTLCEKVMSISSRRADIDLYNLDALDFISGVMPDIRECTLLYLDPPYVQKGPGLYEWHFTEMDHRNLSNCVRRYRGRWMMTNDADALVDELYAPTEDWAITVGGVKVGYSAASTRNAELERLVLGPGMRMPTALRAHVSDARGRRVAR